MLGWFVVLGNQPKPVLSEAVRSKAKGDEEKVATGLAKLHEEDPTFTAGYDRVIKQTIISGLGVLHLDVMVEKLKDKFGVELDQYMDANSSAILVVIDNQYLDGVEAALGKADERLSKAISKGDYDDIVDALNKGGDEVADAIDS